MSPYRAIRLERFAPSFRSAADIIELPGRAPGPDEITVRNGWCGVNGIFDTQIARNAVDYVKMSITPRRASATTAVAAGLAGWTGSLERCWGSIVASIKACLASGQ
jgi:hypothetical protein